MTKGNKTLDFFSKRQKLLEAISIFFIFMGISFKFKNNNVNWIWSDYPFIALTFATIAVVSVLIWIKIERNKIKKTINEIKAKSEPIDINNLLTKRQQQVFELILQNKSNKEISKELFIELSTLKTHINKIYKTLNIKNRTEAKNIKLQKQTYTYKL
jgi:DNA-binding CsgD family transcriptional regulator